MWPAALRFIVSQAGCQHFFLRTLLWGMQKSEVRVCKGTFDTLQTLWSQRGNLISINSRCFWKMCISYLKNYLIFLIHFHLHRVFFLFHLIIQFTTSGNASLCHRYTLAFFPLRTHPQLCMQTHSNTQSNSLWDKVISCTPHPPTLLEEFEWLSAETKRGIRH